MAVITRQLEVIKFGVMRENSCLKKITSFLEATFFLPYREKKKSPFNLGRKKYTVLHYNVNNTQRGGINI